MTGLERRKQGVSEPHPTVGADLIARINALGELSESTNGLTRRSFTPQHRQANDLVAAWMRDAGMAVREDAIGNIIGRYEGASEGAPALMIGSHLDTVVMAGKYDGMLGVLTGIACVEALNSEGLRLPFAVEVIGFVDEEGVRFQSTYLGSRAVTGQLDAALLSVEDKDGVSLSDALTLFGLEPKKIADAARTKTDLLAYLEVHIEQGPVLENESTPVGVVTAISGATRALIVIDGEAGHAGTLPMAMRRDALTAAAECISAIETICVEAEGVVGTVGEISVAPGVSNVVPGRCTFTLDLRAAADTDRHAAFRDIQAKLARITKARGAEVTIDIRHEVSSTPCDATVIECISQAMEGSGHPVVKLPSGAGHDAAAMAALVPVGMLFVRCKGGISHSPAEYVAEADAAAARDVLLGVLRSFPERL